MNFHRFLDKHGGKTLAVLYLLLATPLARSWLETSMSAHMLFQMPLLAALGFIASRLLPVQRQQALLAALGGPLPCVLMASFASSYWMLPRVLDAALGDPLTETAKFFTLPLLIGLPLALAWPRLSLIGRGFVWTNLISMLAVVGWLYIAAPLRVCNNYLQGEQNSTGWLMVKLSILLFAWWFATLFFCSSRELRFSKGKRQIA